MLASFSPVDVLIEYGHAVVNLIAFVAFWRQAMPLISKHGLLPVTRTLRDMSRSSTGRRFSASASSSEVQPERRRVRWKQVRQYPTLCWWFYKDHHIHLMCAAGCIGGVLLLLLPCPHRLYGTTDISLFAAAVGVAWVRAGIWLLMGVVYLSLQNVSGPFLALQMDANLIEMNCLIALHSMLLATHVLSCTLLPIQSLLGGWPLMGRILTFVVDFRLSHHMRWLIFRVMLACGMCKWYGSPMWKSLTAMTAHYETQPLPNCVSWYVHMAPEWWHKVETAMSLVIEIMIPFLVYAPWYLSRLVAFVGFVQLTVMINTTGNYGHLGIMTIVQCLPILYADEWPLSLLTARVQLPSSRPSGPLAVPAWVAVVFGVLCAVVWVCLLAVVYVLWAVSTVPLLQSFKGRVRMPPSRLVDLYSYLRRYKVCNYYAKFGSMNAERLELIVQGQREGCREWLPYEFKFKPCNPFTAPRFAFFYIHRFDWRLWFLPLEWQRARSRRTQCDVPDWYEAFIHGLTLNDPTTLSLIHNNPFPDEAPAKIRTLVVKFSFTPPLTAAAAAADRDTETDTQERPTSPPTLSQQSTGEDDSMGVRRRAAAGAAVAAVSDGTRGFSQEEQVGEGRGGKSVWRFLRCCARGRRVRWWVTRPVGVYHYYDRGRPDHSNSSSNESSEGSSDSWLL
ncbi:unnamed protein product [Vitrella brassicaformis CCMP3155]|uniref:Lipase maturation factor n=1 Tax=Vitrella brassicaformis (strain CCMP3155) TaxID=1169540 RepID=A0A0G4GS17_VITBC|nr:unnamed protein product [Vitrella brassicaformis CCMP3155]|eukprot:CEM33420.1 unnamed protein product [Vitrella brassicaformis CCMP3155]